MLLLLHNMMLYFLYNIKLYSTDFYVLITMYNDAYIDIQGIIGNLKKNDAMLKRMTKIVKMI